MPPQPLLIDITSENLHELPCCGIKDSSHPGVISKRRWILRHLKLGLSAKILIDDDGRPCGYIEYLPGKYAWRGVNATGYMFIHCIWNHSRRNRRKGWASAMIEACISDAKVSKMYGAAVITRESPWMAGSALFESNGFLLVDTAPPDYKLWMRKLKPSAPNPAFRKSGATRAARFKDELAIVRSDQCPYIAKFTAEICAAAQRDYGITPRVVELKSFRDAQNAPTPYSVFSIISRGNLLADHPISSTRFRNIMRSSLATKPRANSIKRGR